jgi:acetylornithine/succinyldiaminopimelate/putrescine aminotransferase
MRLWGVKKGKKAGRIVCVEGNFHGRTLGAAMMSGQAPNDSNIHFLPFPCPWAPRDSWAVAFPPADSVCGVMLETFQGWCAAFYPAEFIAAMVAWCKEHNILLCFDEMQAGFGRTGKKFGYEHYGVTPDLICVGKGMGGGVPLSGVLGRAEILDLPGAGDMSSTHSGNPLVCAAGLAVLKELDSRDLAHEASWKGEILMRDLKAIQKAIPEAVEYVLGRGLIAAILFRNSQMASRVAERCYEKGLLVVHTGRESVKIGPPLTIPKEALQEGCEVLAEAIAEVEVEMRGVPPELSLT